MACGSREATRRCRHSQCPHKKESGQGCVDIINGVCEAGNMPPRECEYTDCEYSFPEDDPWAVKVMEGYSA